MITVYNTGRAIFDYRVSGAIVTIEDNQARDLENEVAQEMIRIFPTLTIIGVSDDIKKVKDKKNKEHKKDNQNLEDKGDVSLDSSIHGKVVEKKEDAKNLSPKEQFEQSLVKDQIYFCSNCSRQFNTNHGLRVHLAVHA